MAASTHTIPPSSYESDPRLPGSQPSHYDRAKITSELHDFYAFLPHVSSSRIHSPPPGGWPSITPENLAKHNIHKTPEVIALLRELTYISGPQPWITTSAFACDYRIVGEDLTIETKPGWVYDAACPYGPPWDAAPKFAPKWPPWTIQLTAGTDREGHHYILDTTDGTATRYCVTASRGGQVPTYPESDPRTWRDLYCEPETWILKDLLEEWKASYRNMEILGVPQPDNYPQVESPDIYSWSSETGGIFWRKAEIEALMKIYREYGWPDNYRKEECVQALHAWWRDWNSRLITE